MHVYSNIPFVVIFECYGEPVIVSTIEELSFYGIENIIGIGYVGSFDDELILGSQILASSSLYDKIITYPSLELNIENIYVKNVWTTNIIYREYQKDIDEAMLHKCTLVNMDTSHLYTFCSLLNIKCIYYAIVSDILKNDYEHSFKYFECK